MHRVRRLSLVIVLVAAAAACGRDDNNSSGDTTTAAAAATTAASTATTASAGSDTTTGDTGGGTATTAADIAAKCASEPLQATEVGITPTDITVEVMADVGSPLAPGLFQGSIDGVQAWAKNINANGGLACRQVKVRTFDSKLTPDDTTNGTIDACQNSLALVGSSSLFVLDPSALATCKDKTG